MRSLEVYMAIVRLPSGELAIAGDATQDAHERIVRSIRVGELMTNVLADLFDPAMEDRETPRVIAAELRRVGIAAAELRTAIDEMLGAGERGAFTRRAQ